MWHEKNLDILRCGGGGNFGYDLGGGLWCDFGRKRGDGKFFYDTREEREILGEKQSPWDELAADEEGLIPFADGFVKLKKID